MAELIIENLCKHFGDVKAVDNVSLTVADGEFLTLLGPSGCGKSTTLFAVAGLDTPTSGRIVVGDKVFFDGATGQLVQPEARNCGLVFQSYALWPHMTVYKNLAFPLELRKIPKAERATRVREALALVEMDAYAERYPHELSGGQQQRVALARTLVYAPSLLLLDEPLSNLDAKLRIRARSWLKELQIRLGITAVYVTHDQIEALSLSDRIAVMDGGKLIQVGTPTEIYRNPATPFVADFIGASNFLNGHVVKTTGDTLLIKVSAGRQISATTVRPLADGTAVRLAVRPEDIQAVNGHAPPKDMNILEGAIRGRDYLGARFQYLLDLGGDEIRVEIEDDISTERLSIAFSSRNCIAFPIEG